MEGQTGDRRTVGGIGKRCCKQVGTDRGRGGGTGRTGG